MVTIALDIRGMGTARKYLERAQPDHPSLVDEGHVMDELFGVVNVPSGTWIDERGMIVRPPEPAFPEQTHALTDLGVPAEGIDPYMREVLEESLKIRAQPRRYTAALRDWVENGAASRFALAPDEVVDRSMPRSPDVAAAAAHFELAQHLFRAGDAAGAVPHFREAHRLQPDNWTYRREAWSIADRRQAPTDVYDSDWVTDVRKVGAENYYPRLDM